MSVDELIARANVIAKNASVTMTALAGPEAAERMLTALVISYSSCLRDLRGAERAGEILYAVADEITTGEPS